MAQGVSPVINAVSSVPGGKRKMKISISPALFIIGFMVGATVAIASIRAFVRPVVSDKEARQEKLNVQRRCEDHFATFPRQSGKTLQEAIEKCRNVAGFNPTERTKR